MTENRKVKQWITVNGVHVPIMEGQTKAEAVQHALNKQKQNKDDADSKNKQIERNKSEADELNRREKEKDEDKKQSETESDKTKYKDAMTEQEFIKSNLKELKEVYKREGSEGVTERWYQTRLEKERQNLKEIPIQDAVSKVRDSIPDNVSAGWFRNANSEYKPKLVSAIMGNEGTLNAGLNMGYHNYRYQFEHYSEYHQKWIPNEGVDQSKKLSFEQWLDTPQTMYRGTYGQKSIKSDIFQSYTPDIKIAQKFLNESEGGKIDVIQIKPRDTWGSYQTTAEQEFLIPVSELKKRGR